MIETHLAATLLALSLGLAILLRRKGTSSHKILGRIWVVLMLFVAAGSFAIREIDTPHMSYIHLLSAWTIVSVSVGVYCIRRHRVTAHAGFMIGTFVGLTVAGAFALLPGRFIWRSLFG